MASGSSCFAHTFVAEDVFAIRFAFLWMDFMLAKILVFLTDITRAIICDLLVNFSVASA